MFVARKENLLVVLAPVVLCLAACRSSAGGEPGGTGNAPAAVGGGSATAAAVGGTSVSAGSGASLGVLATAGAAGAAPASSVGAGAAGSGGEAAAGGASFTAVFRLLTGGCATGGYCHGSSGGLSKLSLVDQAKAYTELVGAPAMGMTGPGAKTMGGCGTTMLIRVEAGDPDNRLLMQKLQGKQTCGDAMPPGGMLLPAELALVHDWIAAGALNN